jgi:hypothetical protein
MANKKIKILAIDDKVDNLVVLKALINDAFPDTQYISAVSGAKGFELCQSEKPDVVLLDIVMPGMDGYEVCTKIKSDIRLRHIPVIMITANRTDKEGRVKALEVGADAFLPKPVDESELKAQIKAMLRIKESEDLKKEEKQRLEDMVLDRTEALERELAERKRAENKLIQSLDKITKNRQAIMNLMEDVKIEIGERKQIEEKLQTERNLLRTLIDNIPFPIYVIDKEGRKIIANRADVENICCSTEEEVIGKTDLELFPGEVGIRGHANNLSVIQTGRPNIDLEENFTDNKGEQRWLLSSHFPLFDNQGEINGLVGIGFDITERKKALAELLESKLKAEESDRLKTAFLHNISHEIRTPMNAIIGFSTLLNEPGLDKETQNSYTGIIMQSTNQLLNIVSDIIEISNIEAGLIKLNKRETNMNSAVTECYARFRKKTEEKGIGFSYETALSDSDSVIITDESKLIQVITYLLNNAVKFTSAGQIIFGYKHKNEQIEFFVSDTGIGIPQEHHSRIYDRFYKVENSVPRLYEGTGLGLPISKAFVELMGGSIWLTSREGGGTIVYFTIPYENIENQAIQISHNELKTNDKVKGKKTILIAEDEDNNYRLMQAILEKHDYYIVHAEHGQKAVEIFESGREVDLIIMDIKMPVMDGYEATRIIKKIKPAVPIIAQTAFAFESDREKALSAGCDDYLSKPVKSGVLIAMIEKYI